jgi:hypothetical protein
MAHTSTTFSETTCSFMLFMSIWWDYVRFQVLTAASMMFRIVFWDVLPCKMIVDHPWWWRQYAPLKRRSTIILHDSTSQKTILNIMARLLLWAVATNCSSPRCYMSTESHSGMISTGENWRTWRISYPSATMSTTNPTLADLGLSSVRPATNRLSYAMNQCLQTWNGLSLGYWRQHSSL